MHVFLDTADPVQIGHWLKAGVIDGVTTNPSIMLKHGVTDLERGARQLAGSIGDRPLSIEVTTNDLGEMLSQARVIAGWAKNIAVKIPIINEMGEPCLSVVHELEQSGIRVNVTACMSFGQAVLAAKAGATYVSLFGGRIADEGSDPATVIGNTRRWLDDWKYASRIIVGSIRTVFDIQQAALAGAHIITIPPQFMAKMCDHKYSRHTVHEFVRDGEQAAAAIKQAASV